MMCGQRCLVNAPPAGPPPPPFAAAAPALLETSPLDEPPAYWSQDLDEAEDEDDGLALPPLSPRPLSEAPRDVPYPSQPSAQLQALLQRGTLRRRYVVTTCMS